MQVNMAMVKQPLITITMFNTGDETSIINRNVDGKGVKNPEAVKSRMHFQRAKRRLVGQGAEGIQVFPV